MTYAYSKMYFYLEKCEYVNLCSSGLNLCEIMAQ
jgi:hypothetical protein